MALKAGRNSHVSATSSRASEGLTQAMGFAGVQCLPEPVRSALGGIQGGRCKQAVSRDQANKFVAPDLRVANVGVGMEGKVSAGAGIGTIVTQQATGLFATNSRHLRFIGIQSRQNLGRGIVAGTVVEAVNQAAYGCGGFIAPHLIGGKSESFGKIKPHIAVSASFDLFLGQVAQDGTPQRTIFEAGMKRAEKRGKGGDVMKIFGGVGAYMIAGKLAGSPRFVKRMIEQFIARDPLIQGGSEDLKIHEKHPTQYK
jgi:hypothetical protein